MATLPIQKILPSHLEAYYASLAATLSPSTLTFGLRARALPS